MIHEKFDEPMNIIISGVESEAYWRIVVGECNMNTVLMSYHYLQKKPEGFLASRLAKHPNVKVFIDSGAHTFLANMEKFEDKDDEFWEKYLSDYVEFIKKNQEFIFACADLDIDDLVGTEKVDQWRKKYFEPLEEEGVQVCYIWHSIREEKGWEDMCRKYSYTGFSMENDKTATLQRIMKRINVAKKYNTRVHGMALTKTEILSRAPFFSADSTTWLVGQKYGELNWFDGRKMRRLSKSEWRRNFKTKLLKEPFNADWDKLINGMGGQGDTYELLRLNVIAYKLAEEYVRRRLGSKQYWMTSGGSSGTSGHRLPRRRHKASEKAVEPSTHASSNAVAVVPTFSSDNSVNYPPLEWFDGECNDYLEYCREFNIDVDSYSKEEAVNILYYFYILLEAPDEVLATEDDDDLIEYAQSIIDSNIDNRDDAIKELRIFYQRNLEGSSHDFNPTDVAEPKERALYLEEEEFILRDLSQDEVDTEFDLKRPKEDADMPEVMIYDEELKARGVEPVRDSKGRFVKGQQRIRKPKNIYSKQYPKLNCDTCYKSGDCPKYKAGYVCAFDKMLNRFDTRNYEDILDAMTSIVNTNLQRMQKALLFETMDGGMPTPEVTGLVDQNMRLLQKIKELQDTSPKTIISQRKVIKEDGTSETVTHMNVNPTSGGILSQIFGANNDDNEKEPEVVDEKVVEAEIIE